MRQTNSVFRPRIKVTESCWRIAVSVNVKTTKTLLKTESNEGGGGGGGATTTFDREPIRTGNLVKIETTKHSCISNSCFII